MAQNTPTTNELIVDSLQLLGELGVDEAPDSFMLSKGLQLLNQLLDKFSSDSIYIPFLTTIDFVMEVGKQTYSVSDMVPADITQDRIIDLSFANYTVQATSESPIIYPLRIISKADYYNIIRLNNLLTRPGFIFLDKQSTESFLTLYPFPDQPYPCSVQCKVMLNAVTSTQELISLPPYFYRFISLALGRMFRAYYPSGNWPETNEQEYQETYKNLKSANETDLTIRPSGIMNIPQGFYYWQTILAYS